MDTKTVSEAAKLQIFNHKGDLVPFGSLFEAQKTVVVFIRHFFCGNCQLYVTQLASQHQSHEAVPVAVIGCGEWNAISNYSELTGFPLENIYADPERKLYRVLGMTISNLNQTPSGEKKRSYLTTGPFANAMLSIWHAVKTPSLIGKQGNITQLGGEFIFGPGHTCTFESRMQHTEDHTEVDELYEQASTSN